MGLQNLVGISLELITPAPETIKRLLDAVARHIADAKSMRSAPKRASRAHTRILRTPHSIAVQPLSPWVYARDLATSGPSSSSMAGADAAWLIARRYSAGHLKKKRMLWWHLSGAALTVWITRNWSSDQVVTTAAGLVRLDLQRADKVRAPE